MISSKNSVNLEIFYFAITYFNCITVYQESSNKIKDRLENFSVTHKNIKVMKTKNIFKSFFLNIKNQTSPQKKVYTDQLYYTKF